ncbi:DUF2218 domain-containing protein [Allosediminivita pacifica]|uniref:DUF2218 domain-containing protein n=1 Tax=Allosediminivita pacifica TaxID=1267769 RepID=A0A2T6APE7_9RHOB|nr:DUF2218 domain-containing protein [Allosediminivita pacifica]PTX45660.1 hypothetical protein C8N44_12014 [Allosediminivita pacifica]GGB06985.1 hypothetical protein GCM10011324_16370 [Allosediminivita pacifica]
MAITETGVFETSNASRYMQQLCKHFAHKVEVEYDEKQARAALPVGPATMNADDSVLRVNISAEDEEGLARARHIIDDHLKRFAHREDFEGMNWQAA